MSVASCRKERKEIKLSWNRIPRKEVEEIAACVLDSLEAFIPSCEYTICGGSVSSVTKKECKWELTRKQLSTGQDRVKRC